MFRRLHLQVFAGLAVGLALFVSGCGFEFSVGSGDDKVDDKELPYSYTIPTDFERKKDISLLAGEGGEGENESGITYKDSTHDAIFVETFSLNLAYNEQTKDAIKAELGRLVPRIAESTDAGSVSSFAPVKVSGLPGWKVSIRRHKASGLKGRVDSDLYFVFKGKTEFQILCQWTGAATRSKVVAGCNEVKSTFKAK